MLVRNPVVAGRRPVPSARSTPGPGRARAGPGRTWPRWAWTWVTTTYMRQSSPPASGLQEFTVSCTVAAICTQSTPLSGSCSAPHARAQATVGMRCTVGATPGMTWWNGAYTRRSLCTRCTRGRPRLCAATGSGGEPQPDRRRRQPQRVLHQRARSLPAARAAGGVHPVWARGGHWTRHRHVASALLCKARFTGLRFHRTDAFWRAEEDSQVVHGGQLPRKNQAFSDLPGSRGTPNGSRKKMVPNWITGTIFSVNFPPS